MPPYSSSSGRGDRYVESSDGAGIGPASACAVLESVLASAGRGDRYVESSVGVGIGPASALCGAGVGARVVSALASDQPRQCAVLELVQRGVSAGTEKT